MRNKYDEEIEDMVDLINAYDIEHDDCGRIDCHECCSLEECYYIAKNKENSEWAKSIGYGGYDTEEEFWEQI